jgi:hypothetical protein
MVDLKYTQHRMNTVAKIHKRLADLKSGDTIKAAELTFIAISDGFTPKTAYDVIDNYKELGVIKVLYSDAKPFSITKPVGDLYDD